MSNVIMPRQGQTPGSSSGGSGNGLALAGFILSLCGLIPFVGMLCAILGLVFSILGLRRSAITGNGKGLAIAGCVISGIFCFTSLFFLMRLF